MTMKPWLARALRRTLGTAVMMIGLLSVIHRLLYPPPAFPPASTDRVVVWDDASPYQISKPERVRRIVAFLRARSDREWIRVRESVHHSHEMTSAAFYRGERMLGSFVWMPGVITVPAGRSQHALFRLGSGEEAELLRLLQD